MTEIATAELAAWRAMPMVVRVARAIFRAEKGRDCDDAFLLGDATGGGVYLAMAHASLVEAREPTEAMVYAAAVYAIPASSNSDVNPFRLTETAKKVWRAMIDTALSP